MYGGFERTFGLDQIGPFKIVRGILWEPFGSQIQVLYCLSGVGYIGNHIPRVSRVVVLLFCFPLLGVDLLGFAPLPQAIADESPEARSQLASILAKAHLWVGQ